MAANAWIGGVAAHSKLNIAIEKRTVLGHHDLLPDCR